MKKQVLFLIDQHPSTFREVTFYLTGRFHDANWLIKIAYLCDIFDFLNYLNLSLQSINIFNLQEKVEAATKKLDFWSRRVATQNSNAFRNLTKLIEKNDISSTADKISIVVKFRVELKTNLQQCFLPINKNKAGTRNHFTVNVESAAELMALETEFIFETLYDSILKDIFSRINFFSTGIPKK